MIDHRRAKRRILQLDGGRRVTNCRAIGNGHCFLDKYRRVTHLSGKLEAEAAKDVTLHQGLQHKDTAREEPKAERTPTVDAHR